MSPELDEIILQFIKNVEMSLTIVKVSLGILIGFELGKLFCSRR